MRPEIELKSFHDIGSHVPSGRRSVNAVRSAYFAAPSAGKYVNILVIMKMHLSFSAYTYIYEYNNLAANNYLSESTKLRNNFHNSASDPQKIGTKREKHLHNSKRNTNFAQQNRKRAAKQSKNS